MTECSWKTKIYVRINFYRKYKFQDHFFFFYKTTFYAIIIYIFTCTNTPWFFPRYLLLRNTTDLFFIFLNNIFTKEKIHFFLSRKYNCIFIIQSLLFTHIMIVCYTHSMVLPESSNATLYIPIRCHRKWIYREIQTMVVKPNGYFIFFILIIIVFDKKKDLSFYYVCRLFVFRAPHMHTAVLSSIGSSPHHLVNNCVVFCLCVGVNDEKIR